MVVRSCVSCGEENSGEGGEGVREALEVRGVGSHSRFHDGTYIGQALEPIWK